MGKVNQVVCSFIVSSSLLILGALLSWPSYTAELLMSSKTPLTRVMTTYEVSLLGGLPCIGALVATPVTGYICDILGRKIAGVLFSVPYLVTWLLIINSNSVNALLVAMFISGLSMGSSQTLAPIFLSEITENSIRGFITATPVLGYCIGTLVSYIIGAYCSFMAVIYIQLAMAVFLFVSLFYVKETPKYLLSIKKEKEALSSLAFYRDESTTSPNVREEFEELKREEDPHNKAPLLYHAVSQQEKGSMNDSKHVKDTKKKTAWRIIAESKSTIRAMAVTMVMLFCSVFMGLVAIQVFAGTLFAETVSELSPSFCSIILGVVLTLGCVISMFISDMLGRRFLMIVSSIGGALCMLMIGSLIQFHWAPDWLIPFFVCLFCLIFNLGGGTVPYILLAEVFLPEVISLTSVILMEFTWFLTFLLIMVFNPLAELLGMHGIFYFFAAMGVLTLILTFFILPETKGISVHEIQDKFYKPKHIFVPYRMSIGGGNCVEIHSIAGEGQSNH